MICIYREIYISLNKIEENLSRQIRVDDTTLDVTKTKVNLYMYFNG